MVVSIITRSFIVYILLVVLKQYPVDTWDKFSCQLTEACHFLYNVQLDDKCENELKYWCRDTDHLFPGKEDECLDICHNIAIHISSVATHDLTVSMHTFLPLLCHMLCPKYDAHVAWLYFYMFHIYAILFSPRPSDLIILAEILEFFKIRISPW